MEGRIVVGYGDGGLAMLDPSTGEKLGDIPLAAHPEGFALDADTQRAFVNEPKALRIGVIDRQSGKEIARWGASAAAANFPMAFDGDSHLLFVAYRIPALITAFDTTTGELVARLPTGGDPDDIFYDKTRSRLYVICGDGSIAVLAVSGHHLQELSRLATRPGARTGLYAPDLDLLFVAAPATKSAPAEIRIYRPH
jgi:DNA-binding beta-propeller fold protein YncE